VLSVAFAAIPCDSWTLQCSVLQPEKWSQKAKLFMRTGITSPRLCTNQTPLRLDDWLQELPQRLCHLGRDRAGASDSKATVFVRAGPTATCLVAQTALGQSARLRRGGVGQKCLVLESADAPEPVRCDRCVSCVRTARSPSARNDRAAACVAAAQIMERGTPFGLASCAKSLLI